MKKIVLSAVALATMATMANASDATELAALKKQMAAMMKKIEMLETKQVKSDKKVEEITVAKGTAIVNSKAPVIELSGTHYLGFVSHELSNGKRSNKFETRRNYLQAKAFFAENPKDYMRLTLDADQNVDGDWAVRVKYAYLYLDSILPNTGVEIGQAHRPWIDYEEHHGWWYRSISKVLVEDDNAAHFTNSADIGVNFQTKTPYFSSELGLFNGEGYHGIFEDEDTGVAGKLSAEWRLTAHLLGTGKDKEKRGETYANVSFFGQNNTDYKGKGADFVWYGLHAVYNQPEFLVAAQYVNATDGGSKYEGDGWSVNGEYRVMKDWNLLARYDNYSLDSGTDRKRTIAGVAYEYNSNVEFIANWLKTDITGMPVDNAFMLTAAVEW